MARSKGSSWKRPSQTAGSHRTSRWAFHRIWKALWVRVWTDPRGRRRSLNEPGAAAPRIVRPLGWHGVAAPHTRRAAGSSAAAGRAQVRLLPDSRDTSGHPRDAQVALKSRGRPASTTPGGRRGAQRASRRRQAGGGRAVSSGGSPGRHARYPSLTRPGPDFEGMDQVFDRGFRAWQRPPEDGVRRPGRALASPSGGSRGRRLDLPASPRSKPWTTKPARAKAEPGSVTAAGVRAPAPRRHLRG